MLRTSSDDRKESSSLNETEVRARADAATRALVPTLLLAHHLASYDLFWTQQFRALLADDCPPWEVREPNGRCLRARVANVRCCPPVHAPPGQRPRWMTPRLAVERQWSYEFHVLADIVVTRNDDGDATHADKDARKYDPRDKNDASSAAAVVETVADVSLGHYPLMVHSSLCALRDVSAPLLQQAVGEAPFDRGAYFVVDGEERVWTPTWTWADNEPRTTVSDDGRWVRTAVRSVADDDATARPAWVSVVASTDRADPALWVCVRAAADDDECDATDTDGEGVERWPLWWLLRQLDVFTDRECVQLCARYAEDDVGLVSRLRDAAEWSASAEPAEEVPASTWTTLLPHVGRWNLFEKACVLGDMARRTVLAQLGRWACTDPEQLSHRRAVTVGRWFHRTVGALWRDAHRRIADGLREHGQRHAAAYAATSSSSPADRGQLYRFEEMVSACRETVLVPAMAEMSRACRAQFAEASTPLDRRAECATWRQLRAVAGATALPGTAYGLLDPVCPEQLAAGATLTAGARSRRALRDGLWAASGDAKSPFPLRRLADAHAWCTKFATRVFADGQLVGVLRPADDAEDPFAAGVAAAAHLRRLRAQPTEHAWLPADASIAFDVARNDLCVWADAGRCTRAVADSVPGRRPTDRPTLSLLARTPSVAWLDAAEQEHALVAPTLAAWLSCTRHTHLDLHPSLLLGWATQLCTAWPHHAPVASSAEAVRRWTAGDETVGRLTHPGSPLVSSPLVPWAASCDSASVVVAFVATGTPGAQVRRGAVERGLFRTVEDRVFRGCGNGCAPERRRWPGAEYDLPLRPGDRVLARVSVLIAQHDDDPDTGDEEDTSLLSPVDGVVHRCVRDEHGRVVCVVVRRTRPLSVGDSLVARSGHAWPVSRLVDDADLPDGVDAVVDDLSGDPALLFDAWLAEWGASAGVVAADRFGEPVSRALCAERRVRAGLRSDGGRACVHPVHGQWLAEDVFVGLVQCVARRPSVDPEHEREGGHEGEGEREEDEDAECKRHGLVARGLARSAVADAEVDAVDIAVSHATGRMRPRKESDEFEFARCRVPRALCNQIHRLEAKHLSARLVTDADPALRAHQLTRLFASAPRRPSPPRRLDKADRPKPSSDLFVVPDTELKDDHHHGVDKDDDRGHKDGDKDKDRDGDEDKDGDKDGDKDRDKDKEDDRGHKEANTRRKGEDDLPQGTTLLNIEFKDADDAKDGDKRGDKDEDEQEDKDKDKKDADEDEDEDKDTSTQNNSSRKTIVL